MDTKTILEFENILLKDYKLWGLDNLDLIEILDVLRELKNG
jgi:hypothetical protein